MNNIVLIDKVYIHVKYVIFWKNNKATQSF